MITKFDKIPEELLEYTDAALESNNFADDVNEIYPITDEVAVAQSFVNLRDNPYKDYSKADTLYILDRICLAAEKFEVNLDDLLSESLGGEIMSVDKNSPEFREAVEAATKEGVDKMLAEIADKDTHAKALQDLNDRISGTESKSEALEKELVEVKAAKEGVEKELSDYKTEIESKAKIRGRIDELKAIGLEKDDWSDTEEAVTEMSDKVFAAFKDQVAERVKSEAALHNLNKKGKKLVGGDDEEENKNKKDKDKDKDKDKGKKGKNPFAKSSTDIVEESKSEGTLPNGEENESKDKDLFPELTKAFAKSRESRY